MKIKPIILGIALASAVLGASGCGGYYTAYPGYGPYYGGYGGGPYYGSPGSVTIAVGDRPYYVRGPGYWYGGAYYGREPRLADRAASPSDLASRRNTRFRTNIRGHEHSRAGRQLRL